MKRRRLSALMAALLLLPLMAAPAAADNSCGDSVTWTLDGGTLIISGSGNMKDYKNSSFHYPPWYSEKDKTQDSITRAVIENGVTGIGGCAFSECVNLVDVTISQSVTSIGENAFSGCTRLKQIDIPSGVKEIGDGAFGDCTSLADVTIPQSVTSIGTGAFSRCIGLTDIDIPSSVKSIGPFAFERCEGLTSVVIPSSITIIQYRTFQSCPLLKDVFIPKSVVKIEEGAFSNSDLKTVHYEGSEEDWNKIQIDEPNLGNILLTNLANKVDGGEIIYNSTGPATYTVTFNAQGGSAVSQVTVTAGGKVTKPADPTRSGHTFGGWFKESGCTTAWSFDSDTVTGDITLYAKWTADSPDPVTYTVTFDAQGGSAVPSASVAQGGKVTKPADPTRSGYTFGGWFKESGCTTAWDFDSGTVTGDMTLYAKWTRESSGGGDAGYDPPTVYPIVPQDEPLHGRLEVSRSNAERGVTVRVTAVPEEGYRLETLKAVRGSRELPLTDKGGGSYAFVMPAGPVRIEAVFVKAETAWTSPYADVAGDAWYYDAVRFVSESGVMSGYGDGQFGVNDPLSRAQLVQILYNKEGRPPAGGEAGFADTVPDAWYSAAVAWAAERGVVSGYADGRFNPDSPITREQLAAMLWRYAGSPAPAERELSFADAEEAGDYALEALGWAVEEGILSGYGDGRLAPRGPATRAHAAEMLRRFLER